MIRGIANLQVDAARVYGPEQRAALDPDAALLAIDNIRTWPGYAPTPLVELPGLSATLGVARIWIKDEGQRQPLASFKVNGAAYALGEALRDRVEAESGYRPAYVELWAGRHAAIAANLHAVAATDGNHGRSLAWGASQFGCTCTIFLPSSVSAEREALIARFGAKTCRVEGVYEDAVAAAISESERVKGVLIQDTTIPAHRLATRRIMEGYMLMAAEIRDQLPELPTHVFAQVGCGGFAAAVAADWWLNGHRPTFVCVEPANADCMLRSFERGEPAVVGGDHETIMIGLAVGEVSEMAWDILRYSADYAVAIDDQPAREAMRLTARGVGGDPNLVMGETGASGLGALLEAARTPPIARMLGLDGRSRVLLINTEGAVDEKSYASIVGEAVEA